MKVFNCKFVIVFNSFQTTKWLNSSSKSFCRKLDDSTWLTKELLENKIIEEITDKQYEDFIAMMNRLLQHPYSYQVKDFIMSYRRNLIVQYKGREIVEPKIGEDGRKYVTTYGNSKQISKNNAFKNW